ncbi:hypothetical protein ERJ75_000753100 [Trypanosoma vivax]|uniref:Uncharacterized protein n=1 Tax=Trypanosoma vivax (strain Y486) TaxID=1055687 RepID=G0U044_TRYVY|nr:hypothetical protein TRVL_01680 [Trypanosoma vivax]KAH8613675.1 hypothetical protein ERJ75_000753100 [Trypanosoma vivax]CCC49441.1 conserved hypothetical protein [Trypanosoma vivax Y486]
MNIVDGGQGWEREGKDVIGTLENISNFHGASYLDTPESPPQVHSSPNQQRSSRKSYRRDSCYSPYLPPPSAASGLGTHTCKVGVTAICSGNWESSTKMETEEDTEHAMHWHASVPIRANVSEGALGNSWNECYTLTVSHSDNNNSKRAASELNWNEHKVSSEMAARFCHRFSMSALNNRVEFPAAHGGGERGYFCDGNGLPNQGIMRSLSGGFAAGNSWTHKCKNTALSFTSNDVDVTRSIAMILLKSEGR